MSRVNPRPTRLADMLRLSFAWSGQGAATCKALRGGGEFVGGVLLCRGWPSRARGEKRRAARVLNAEARRYGASQSDAEVFASRPR
jgi:hypothetical protein